MGGGLDGDCGCGERVFWGAVKRRIFVGLCVVVGFACVNCVVQRMRG